MKKHFTLEIDIELVDGFNCNDTIGRVYYPGEGNNIQILKGLNVIEFSDVIHHEIGHLFDWYISNGNQSPSLHIREANANCIGDALRFKTYKGNKL